MNKYSKAILALLISAASVLATSIAPALPLFQEIFNIKTDQLSSIMTIYLNGYLLGQFFFAHVSKKIGLLLSIKYGFTLATVGTCLQIFCINSNSFFLFITFRFITAFGLSSGLVCGFVIIKNFIRNEETKKYLSLIGITFTASIYLSIYILGHVLTNFGILAVLYSSLAYSLSLFLLSFYIKLPINVINKNINTSLRHSKIVINYKLISYSLTLSMTTVITYSYAFYAPLISFSLYGLSPVEFGKLNLSNMFCIFIGNISYVLLNKKYKEDSLLIFCLTTIILIGFVFFLICKFEFYSNIKLFFLSSGLLNFFSGLIYPAATFKALECGLCKENTSATMNTIKLIMPTAALCFSSLWGLNSLLSLSAITVLFSFIYLLFFMSTKLNVDGDLA